MENLLHAFFSNRSRRIKLIMNWNVQQPVKGKTMTDFFLNFIQVILYKPIYISIRPNDLTIFKNERGLRISYTRMTKHERDMVYEIYCNRYKLFSSVQIYQDGSWLCDGLKKEVILKTNQRREILRDFVHFLLFQKKVEPDKFKWPLITSLQILIEKYKKRDDDFVRQLHDKLQGIGNINLLLAFE